MQVGKCECGKSLSCYIGPANVAVYLAADADEEIKKLIKSNEGKIFMVLETINSLTFRLGATDEKT